MASLSPAHIVNQAGHDVGDKVLAVCGKKIVIETLWGDLPKDHPICRDCVEVAVLIMNEASEVQADTLEALLRVDRAVSMTTRQALGGSTLSSVIDDTNEYAEKQEAKAAKKQALADARALVEKADEKANKKAKKNKSEDPPNTVDS